MPRIVIYFILIFIFNILMPHTSGEPNPTSPYKFFFGTKSEAIERELLDKQNFYKDIEWSAVELSVNENNIEVYKNIAKIDAEMQVLYSQLRKLRLATNLKQIEDNLLALKTARSSIIRTTEMQLQAINYQGLYLAIHNNAGPLDKEVDLVSDMRNVISPTAIATANGAFSQNILALQSNKVEYDYILEKISGSMEAVNSLYTDANKTARYFVQIRQEKIYPLRKSLKMGNQQSPNTTYVKVIDLYNNENYMQDLTQMLADPDLRTRLQNGWLSTRLPEFKKAIAKYNESSRLAETSIVIETQKQLAEIDKEIANADRELNEKRNEVQKILKNIGMTNCTVERLPSCIEEAEKRIATSMKQLEKNKIEEKEKELVAQVFDVSGQGGEPSKAIASETYLKVETLNKSNGIVKSFLQELSIVNGMVNSYGSAGSSDVFRSVQHFWMYPMTTNQNQYQVGVVLRFKLGDELLPPIDTCDFTFAAMIKVYGSSFIMGCKNGRDTACIDTETPEHLVTLKSFWIGKYEVTQKQWKSIMGTNPSFFKGDELPVENVSWNDIQVFLKKLNTKYPSCNYRLPTEAEWEYAARGGKKSKNYFFSGSNIVQNVAWYNLNSDSCTHRVGGKNANELKIYDMSGNVWEWCSDVYAPYTGNTQSNKPNETSYVIRGGSWYRPALNCRPSARVSGPPNDKNHRLGFRLCAG